MNAQKLLSIGFLCGISLLSPGQARAAQTALPGPPPDLKVEVTLDRTDLQPGDPIAVTIRVDPLISAQLSTLQVELAGPRFIGLAPVDPLRQTVRASSGGQPIDLIQPGPQHRNVFHLKLYSADEIREGEIDLVFLFYSTWSSGQTSFASVDRRIQLNLFGTDSVSGVPLQLAAFVLPGLLALGLLALFRFKPLVDLNWSLQAFLSVGTSLVLALLSWQIFPAGTPMGMSRKRLVYLCLTGAAIGLLLIVGRKLRNRYRESHFVLPNEDSATVLLKALKYHRKKVVNGTPVCARLGQNTLLGSVAMPRADGEQVLYGWFEVDVAGAPRPWAADWKTRLAVWLQAHPACHHRRNWQKRVASWLGLPKDIKPEDIRRALRVHEANGDWRAMLILASRYGLPIRRHDSIKTRAENAWQWTSTHKSEEPLGKDQYVTRPADDATAEIYSRGLLSFS